MEAIPLALTYDDVLLIPRFSSVRTRREVDTGIRFTQQIRLKVPLVSANMDTVTEAKMAIAVAEFGGIGVIHRFLPIEAQVSEVARVKRYQSEIIEDPHTISPNATIGEAREFMSRWGISGLPVTGEQHQLLGIITRRDLQFCEDKVQVSDRMTPWEHLVIAPPDVSRKQAQEMLAEHRLEKLPLVDTGGRLVGLITAKDLATHPEGSRSTRDDKGRLQVAAAVDVVGDYLERSQELVSAGADALVIDIAHGDSALMVAALSQLRERLGDVPLVAGNVATAEGTERLIDAGADAVKVGVGPGSMCITRQVAGVGVPQLTAILECAQVAHQRQVPLIADGGIRYPGDVAKAIAAGASTVMLGNLLSGTDESPGVVVSRNGQKMKVARGMASMEAALDRSLRDDPEHGWARWEAAEGEIPAEGVQAPVHYRGAAREVLQHLLGGLRSGMSYCGANSIEETWRNARFVRQTEAGFRESGPHDTGSF
jgi:IMP dehydrogenase